MRTLNKIFILDSIKHTKDGIIWRIHIAYDISVGTGAESGSSVKPVN